MFGLAELNCGQLIKEVLNPHTSAWAVKSRPPSHHGAGMGGCWELPKEREDAGLPAAATPPHIEKLGKYSFIWDFEILLGKVRREQLNTRSYCTSLVRKQDGKSSLEANFCNNFYKGPDSKYFQLGKPCALCHNC